MAKINFQHSFLQSSVSHDLICWFGAQLFLFIIIINFENDYASWYSSGNHDTFFSGFFDEIQEQHLFEIETL